MNKNIYLAIDSGGSKTLWSIIDKSGVTLHEIKTAGLGAVREGLLPVDETVGFAANELKHVASPNAIFLSLGGPNTCEVEAALTRHFPNIPVKVEREACGNAILRAAAYMNCTSVVMCGTGSVAAANMGADIISTTLSGYTDYSPFKDEPDLELVKRLRASISTPIIAEGRYNSPALFREAIKAGAHAVVVGKAITNITFNTKLFIKEAGI